MGEYLAKVMRAQQWPRVPCTPCELPVKRRVSALGACRDCRRRRAVRRTGNHDQGLLDGLANPSRWLTYSGDYTGQRFSPLTQITAANADQLAAQWTFQTGVVNKFEATPIVIDGMLYVTGALNHAWAIDGRTGTSDLALPANAARRD